MDTDNLQAGAAIWFSYPAWVTGSATKEGFDNH
jgi:hypothetical protein